MTLKKKGKSKLLWMGQSFLLYKRKRESNSMTRENPTNQIDTYKKNKRMEIKSVSEI